MDALVHRGRPSGVRTVIVAGEVVLRDGQSTRLDKGAIMEELAASLRAPLTPAEQRRREVAPLLLPHVARFYDGWLDEQRVERSQRVSAVAQTGHSLLCSDSPTRQLVWYSCAAWSSSGSSASWSWRCSRATRSSGWPSRHGGSLGMVDVPRAGEVQVRAVPRNGGYGMLVAIWLAVGLAVFARPAELQAAPGDDWKLVGVLLGSLLIVPLAIRGRRQAARRGRAVPRAVRHRGGAGRVRAADRQHRLAARVGRSSCRRGSGCC